MIPQLPPIQANRGPLFWLRPANLWSSRRKLFRADHSNEWRYEFLRESTAPPPPPEYPSDPQARTRPYTWLLDSNTAPRDPKQGFSAVILGDTGEGDASQYTLLPLIRALNPDFMIINGDVAYPAGNMDDFVAGFFEPYKNLRIPIWAVPGNHEYYSEGRGKEFFEVFCSTIRATSWADSALVMKPQPGSYWELAEEGVPLVILGVDSGQAGNLDGSSFLGLFKRDEDRIQHQWLKWRLERAEAQQTSVVLLFHIPKLVNGDSDNGVHLDRVHEIIAGSRAIKLVIAAHIHNMQWYKPDEFAKYLEALTGNVPLKRPDYVVSGSGGATVGSTRFKGKYAADPLYPTPEEFDKFAAAGERLVAKLPDRKTILGDALSEAVNAGARLFKDENSKDADQMRLQSLLYLKYAPQGGVTVVPYYVNDLNTLYPADATVQVQEGIPPLLGPAVDTCRRKPELTL